jgi:hypothetical protein
MNDFIQPSHERIKGQLDISRYSSAITMLKIYLLDSRNKSLSCSAIRHRLDKLPHSFLPVGDGRHIIPITIHGWVLGYSGPTSPETINHRKDLWIPEAGIDRGYLRTGGPFFGRKLAEEMLPLGILPYGDVLPGDVLFDDRSDALLARSPEGRRELAIRSYRVFQPLGFPNPRVPSGTWARIGTRLHEEKEARRNRTGMSNE